MGNDTAGELLGYVLMITAGLAFSAWFFQLSPQGQQEFVDRVFGLLTVVLAQPGVFATAKIASNSQLPLRKRVFLAVSVFAIFACLVPMAFSNWIAPVFRV